MNIKISAKLTNFNIWVNASMFLPLNIMKVCLLCQTITKNVPPVCIRSCTLHQTIINNSYTKCGIIVSEMHMEGLQTPSIQLSLAWFVTFTACHAKPNTHKQHTALPGHTMGLILYNE